MFTSAAMLQEVTNSFKGRYVFYCGGWAGGLDGRVISKYFTNWGGSNLFDTQPGEGYSFFLARKILLHVG